MALDTYGQIWNRVLLRCPALGPKLAQDMVTNAFRRLAESHRWSWLVKFGQFVAPSTYNTGTINVTQGSTIVTGTGTTFDPTMIGRQLRIGLVNPIYTIANVDSATQFELDSPWGGITATNQVYMIYLAFYTPPTDFHQFVTLWDPAFNWQLYLDISQSEINIFDPQRANVGNAYVVSFRDYTTSQVGTVGPVVHIGTGPIPILSGPYTAPVNGIFNISVVVGGVAGSATYQWSFNGSPYSAPVTTDPSGLAQSLLNGVTIAFPLGFTYTAGDLFTVSCTAIANAGLPRYELWPHQQANHVYPFLYEQRPTDLADANAVLPRYIRGDVLMDMAMEEVCSWPGPSPDKPNIYYSIQNGQVYARKNARNLQDMQRQDDEVYVQQISYQYPSLAFAYASVLGDAKWLQSHAI
jgi:hypothetical protein